MSDSLYCALCSQFVQGDIKGLYDGRDFVFFHHHPDFESLDKAMKLPCSICSLVWGNAGDPPHAFNWERPLQVLFENYSYSIEGALTMSFMVSAEGELHDWGSPVIFVPWPSPIESQTPHHPMAFNSPAALTEFHIPGTLSSTTRSDSSLDFVLEKFRQCCKTHTRCQTQWPVSSPIYPSRLLDVGSEPQSAVVLCNTALFREETYVCLSHCWGTEKPFTLNAQTQSALMIGVDTDALPKTYREAIFVTRLLKVRYIWIDSLCILQDNKDDWAYEAQRMGDIYANAVCTIAATASKDSSRGLFFERDPVSILPRRVRLEFMQHPPWSRKDCNGHKKEVAFLCDVSELAGRCIEEAPLNNRAWVAQERQLSTRIIHFTSTQLFWECYETTACETYPEGLPEWARPNSTSDGTLLKKNMRSLEALGPNNTSISPGNAQIYPLDNNIRINWLMFRDLYSRRALTNACDKLVAIQGVAKWVGQATNDHLVAGQWRSHLVEELCWYKNEGSLDPEVWRAPSWSWASSDAAIEHSLLTRSHINHPGLQLDVEVIDLDIGTKSSGELQHASLGIKCRPLYAIYNRYWAQGRKDGIDVRNSLKQILPDNPRDRDLHLMESLELKEGDGVQDARRVYRFARPLMNSCMDILYAVDKDPPVQKPPEKKIEVSYGYVVLVQHCLHEGKPDAHVDTQERNDRRMSWASEIEERDSDYDDRIRVNNNPNQDNAEALLLQTSDNLTFKRIGLLCFHRDRAVQQLLEAHSAAEERIITLI